MPVDFNKAEKKVEEASSFFSSLNGFIKKHPIWFTIILIVLLSELGYLSTSEDEDYEDPYHDEMILEGDTLDEYYYDEEYEQETL